MIVFVDNEHETGYAQPWGERLMAARVRIKYRLEDMTGQPCLIVRWNRVMPELLQELKVQALFISGNSANPDTYDPTEQAGLLTALQSQRWPTFGFCGGLQIMAQAYGVAVEPIGPLAAGMTDPQPEFAPGMQKEFGYQPVQIGASHSLLDGLGDAPVFRQAHSWELKAVPQGFGLYASTEITPVQLIIHHELPIVGTQFHPEYYTDEYPDGFRLIQNFCRLAGLIS